MVDKKHIKRHGLPKAWQAGFTLIELMVVLVIIGLLAALVVPNVLNRADDARVTAARTDITQLMQALKLYRLDNLRYPTAEQGLASLVKKPDNGPQPLGTSLPIHQPGHASRGGCGVVRRRWTSWW